MAEYIDRYSPRVSPREFRVDGRILDCLVGLPPASYDIRENAVQLNTGLASGPTMFEQYGMGLNLLGYPTVIVSPRHPTTKSHKDVARVSEAILEGEFGFDADLLSYATHSLGTRNTILGLVEHPDEELIDSINNIIEVAPVGYGGVQHLGGALQTVANEFLHMPHSKHVRALAQGAFWYGIRANLHLNSLIEECRSSDLREPTRELIARGIGIGAVLYANDHMIRSAESEIGLREAGVTRIELIPGDHNSVLFRAEQTIRAGLRVRDGLDADRQARERP